MHQYRIVMAYIIRVVIRNAEVIHLYRRFQYLVLDLLDYNVLSIEQLQSVACAEIYRTDPALFRHIERVVRGRVDLGVTVTHMNDLIRLVDEHILDLFELRIAGLGRDRPHPVALADFFDGLHAVNRNRRGAERKGSQNDKIVWLFYAPVFLSIRHKNKAQNKGPLSHGWPDRPIS